MKINFNFNKEEAYLIATALQTQEEILFNQGEEEKSDKTRGLREKFFELYNMRIFEETS